jgi:protein tyrosine phosphatase (PTP) superfamily phosphohydrolase (DUF442 family)
MGSEMFFPLKRAFSFIVFLILFSASFASNAKDSVATVSIRPSEWAVPLEIKGLSNLHQVTPMIYRSAQPDNNSGSAIAKLGIKTVLSFRKRNKDEPLHKTPGVVFKRYPLYTWDIEEKDILAVLRILNDPANQPILVHCTHGADRTGLMMASYRMIVQNWSKQAAIAEMKQGEYEYHVIWKNIEHRIAKMDIAKMRAELYAGK